MFTIPNLGLSIQEGFSYIIGVSFFLTFISFINNHPIVREIKKKEENLSFLNYVELYVNRFIHYTSTICIMFLPYIFKPELILYIIYEVYLIIALYSWYLLKECPISIHEKQLLDPKYLNRSTNIQPFISLLMMPNHIYIITFLIIYSINLSLISYVLYNSYFLEKL